MDDNMEDFVIKRRSVDGRRESKREKDNVLRKRVNVRKEGRWKNDNVGRTTAIKKVRSASYMNDFNCCL